MSVAIVLPQPAMRGLVERFSLLPSRSKIPPTSAVLLSFLPSCADLGLSKSRFKNEENTRRVAGKDKT